MNLGVIWAMLAKIIGRDLSARLRYKKKSISRRYRRANSRLDQLQPKDEQGFRKTDRGLRRADQSRHDPADAQQARSA